MPAVRLEELLETTSLIIWGMGPPVLLVPIRLEPAPNDLERLVASLPSDQSTQRRMTIDHMLPAACEGGRIESSVEPAGVLLEVEGRLRRVEGVEQDSLLDRCQRVDRLDIGVAGGHLASLTLARRRRATTRPDLPGSTRASGNRSGVKPADWV